MKKGKDLRESNRFWKHAEKSQHVNNKTKEWNRANAENYSLSELYWNGRFETIYWKNTWHN